MRYNLVLKYELVYWSKLIGKKPLTAIKTCTTGFALLLFFSVNHSPKTYKALKT
jgi:hypothetical protein